MVCFVLGLLMFPEQTSWCSQLVSQER